METETSLKPWYYGLRKWSFAMSVLLSLDWAAYTKLIDGAQFLGAVGGLAAAFFTANYVSKAKEKTGG